MSSPASVAAASTAGRSRPSLMIPGPCELDSSVLSVLGRQTTPHYGEAWATMFRSLLERLERLLGASRTYLLPGSGTMGLEVAISTMFDPGDRVVVPFTGYFSTRLAEIGAALGLAVDVIDLPLNAPIDLTLVEARMQGAAGVLAVHVDSTTGIVQPIAELSRRARQLGVRTVVDAVASVGGEAVHLREDGVDALVTAPQKGLGAPPGLAVVALGEAGWDRVRDHRRIVRSWYLDLARWEAARLEDASEPHPVTMPTAIVLALSEAVGRIEERGIAGWLADRKDLTGYLRSLLVEAGFRLHVPSEHAATLVTVVRVDDPSRLRTATLESGIMIGQGLPPLEDAIRIGLLGRTATRAWVDRVVSALSSADR